MRALSIAIMFVVSLALGSGPVASGWAFPSQGVVNDDFTYRNLLIGTDGDRHFLSGLLKNRSDEAHLGVVILFRALDCVTHRSKWTAPLYIENIDPQVEMPFKINLAVPAPGYVCRFSCRTAYNRMPVRPAPEPQKPAAIERVPAKKSESPQRGVYAWIDGSGVIHYSPKPAENRVWDKLAPAPESESEPIYAWIDQHGATRYSDRPPDPRKLGKHRRQPMLAADNMEAYARAIRQRIWAGWSHPLEVSSRGKPFDAAVRFYVLRDGRIRKIRVEQSCGIDALDESFYNAVAKADPLPPLPGDFAGKAFDARIWFVVRDVP